MSRNFLIREYPSLTAVCHQMALRAPSGLTAHSVAELTGYSNYTLRRKAPSFRAVI